MPAKKTTQSKKAPTKSKTGIKAKKGAPKTQAKPKRHLSAVKSGPNLKMAHKKKSEPKKVKKLAKPPQASNLFWKILEERKQERENRNQEGSTFGMTDNRNISNDKHARFGRFAGPRRRAA